MRRLVRLAARGWPRPEPPCKRPSAGAPHEEPHALPSEPVGLFTWIVLGFIAGSIAGIATNNRREGCVTRVAVGILGALIGGALARAAGLEGVTLDEFSLRTVIVSALGATLLLLMLQAMGTTTGRRR